jgi:FkbM family methyltransferase
MKTYIQIGANIGKDYFHDLLTKEPDPIRVILVEPNPELIPELFNNYNDLLKKHQINFVEGGIVADKSHNQLNLYSDVYDSGNVLSGLSSIIARKSYNHKLNTIKFQPYTFTELCRLHDVTEVDFLMIDTEGYDYTILNSIDLEKVQIQRIICEKWNHAVDSTEEIQTGPEFFDKVIRKKYKDYVIEELDIAGDPNYIFYAKNA